MFEQDPRNRVIDQPVGGSNSITKISITMPNDEERMIVVGGMKLDDGVELPI